MKAIMIMTIFGLGIRFMNYNLFSMNYVDQTRTINQIRMNLGMDTKTIGEVIKYREGSFEDNFYFYDMK